MMVTGIDAHKRSHTAVTVDEMGRQGFVKTVGTHDTRCSFSPSVTFLAAELSF